MSLFIILKSVFMKDRFIHAHLVSVMVSCKLRKWFHKQQHCPRCFPIFWYRTRLKVDNWASGMWGSNFHYTAKDRIVEWMKNGETTAKHRSSYTAGTKNGKTILLTKAKVRFLCIGAIFSSNQTLLVRHISILSMIHPPRGHRCIFRISRQTTNFITIPRAMLLAMLRLCFFENLQSILANCVIL